VIVAVYLSASLAIGVIVNRYIHDVTTYLVGGRSSGSALNIATYIGTSLGLVTLMVASIDGLSNGFAYLPIALIAFAASFFLGATGFVITRLRRMELLTIPEFFGRRFNRRTRILAGVICAVSGVLNMGLFPKMGATFITYVTGLGTDGSFGAGDHEMTINLITSLLIVMVLIYTVLGGMVSVIVTDYIQFVVLSIGMGLGLWFCLSNPALGWENITTAMAEHRGERMFNPVAEGGYGWLWLAYMSVLLSFAAIAWAPEATRALTSRDESGTRRTFLFGGIGMFIRFAIPVFWAAAAFCLISQSPQLTQHFFPDGLDGAAENAAQAMPLVLGKIVPTGLLGVLVAGLLAAFMSTHDSYLLCWSSVISRDVVGPMVGGLSDRSQITVTRISVVLIGLFLLAWGVWYKLPDSVWSYMAITGTIYLSGAVVSLIGGLYWKRASSAGALAALLGGLLAIAGVFTRPINQATGWSLNEQIVGMATFGICAVLFIVFSLLYPDLQPATEEGV